MQLVTATEGMKGLDVNEPIDITHATMIKDAGYVFVMRYIPRDTPAPHDVSKTELQTLLDAGLLVGLVQHVKSETRWVPSPDLGTYYGQNAVTALGSLGVITGTPVWLDLEGIDTTVAHNDIVGYCNNWYMQLAPLADPGIYVGWHSDLTPQELYSQLHFKRYWGSYNLNADEFPAVRGLQLKQHSTTAEEIAQVGGLAIDTDTVIKDKLGGLPVFLGN